MKSRCFAGIPPHGRTQRIGLFGGSFNPPHLAHRMASLLALRRLELDWIWWFVSPGNPLKDRRDLAPLDERLRAATEVAAHPRIVVTSFECRLGSSYTRDLVSALLRRRKGARFVFCMGADSFADLHRWKSWRLVADAIPLCVIDRPGFTTSSSPAGILLARRRISESDATLVATAEPPAYVLLHGKRSTLSSTEIRQRRGI